MSRIDALGLSGPLGCPLGPRGALGPYRALGPMGLGLSVALRDLRETQFTLVWKSIVSGLRPKRYR